MESQMMTTFDRITSDPAVLNGQPCIRGLRLTVRRVLEALAIIPIAMNYERSILSSKMKTFANPWNMLPQILTTASWSCDPRHEAAFGSRTAAIDCKVFGGCRHVGEMGMASANDQMILDTARESQTVVVTLDADFHYLLAASQATSPSVVRIRTEGLKGNQLAAILVQVIAKAMRGT